MVFLTFPSKSFKKRLINTNVYKITHEARFDWKRFLNIYEIAKEMKVMLDMFFQTFIMTWFINSTSTHKMFKRHC